MGDDSSSSGGGSSSDSLAKNLFSDSPSNIKKRTATPTRSHYDIWGSRGGGGGSKREPRMGCFGAAVFFALCVTAVALTIQFNAGEWRTFLSVQGWW